MKIRSFFFVLLLVSGCRTMENDPYNRFRPRGDPWLLRGQYQGNLDLKYSHFYIHQRDPSRVERLGSKRFEVMFFFKSGHLLVKAFDDFEEIRGDNFLYNSQVGFFSELNGNVLIEVWAAINLGQTGYEIFQILDTGDLKFISSGPSIRRQHRLLIPEIFSPILPEKPLDFEPDW